MANDIVIYAVDVGSISKGRFGWCRLENGEMSATSDDNKDINKLVSGIIKDLKDKRKVALGFECPLFVPVTKESDKLIKARENERNRAWCASAGCTSLAVGLAEYAWIFSEIKKGVKEGSVVPTFELEELKTGKADLLIWEAFVSRESKSNDPKSKENKDVADAITAAKGFEEYCCSENNSWQKMITTEEPFNLVAAALLSPGFLRI